MNKLFTAILLALTITVSAQRGDFLLTDHFPTQSNIDNANFEIISDNNGLIYLANRAGVLTYDGDVWDFFKTPSAALSIDVDDNGVIYVGSIGTLGKIDFQQNKFAYQPLLATDTLNDLFLQTIHFQNKVYFLGSEHVGVYDIEKSHLKMLEGEFLNLFQIEDHLYVNGTEETFEIKGDTLEKIDLGLKVASAHNFNKRPTLLIDFDGNISIWDKRAKRITHNSIIEKNGFQIEEAKWVNDSLFVCSTFSNGAVLLNYNDLDYLEVTDYHSGLPDNEIYATHTDGQGGIWIAHPFGLTSVSPLFPAFSFSNFPGLKGNLTGFFQKDADLWITTSQGLFHFDKDTIFKNKVYYTEIKTKRSQPKTQPKQEVVEPEKKSILKGLFRKKNRAQQTASDEKKGFFRNLAQGVSDVFENSDDVERVDRKQAKNKKYKRNVRKIPVRINYHFSKLDGTDGKYFDIIELDDQLLLIGNTGVYEITDDQATLVISENVRSAIVVSSGQLIISTSNFELKSFERINNIWIEQVARGLDDIIVNMLEDQSGKVWLAGSNSLYSLSVTDSTLNFSQTYKLKNQSLDDVDMLERSDTTYFINSQGYFYYDKSLDEIAENSSYMSQIGIPIKSISDPTGHGVWINNGKNWHLIPQSGPVEAFEYMNLFQDLVTISKDIKSEEYWLTTRDNQLLKYDPSKNNKLSSAQLFIKKLSNQKGAIDQRSKFTLSYDENFLSVVLSKPDYLGLLNPEFQYKLTGLHTEWSDWSRNKSIDFSYLPAGQYSLDVRSRDAFDRIEEVNMLNFTVRSPYWQRPWFYALQIIFFGALVVISSRMNQSKTQNRLLSQGLSVLTLILIIEFIQSAVGALLSIQSTPVIDFMIDVFVALLIFPLEKFLREFLSHGKVDVKIPENLPGVKKKKVSNKEN